MWKGGTDAGAAHLKNGGVPSTTIGVCARYIHSHQTLYAMDDFLEAQAFLQALVKKIGSFYSRFNQKLLNRNDGGDRDGRTKPRNLIRDLYNNARQNLSEDLVLALVETAKQLPSTK